VFCFWRELEIKNSSDKRKIVVGGRKNKHCLFLKDSNPEKKTKANQKSND
jgi:hypothetical protein